MAIAIVLAAGTGSRMKSDIPKQFLKINNLEVIAYSLIEFQKNSHISDIILVTSEPYISFCENDIVTKYALTKVKNIICGGKERYDSVYNGLKAAANIFQIKKTNRTVSEETNLVQAELQSADTNPTQLEAQTTGTNPTQLENQSTDANPTQLETQSTGTNPTLAGYSYDEEDVDIVMIHDGARPFITQKMIDDSINSIISGNAGCTVAMPVKDTIKIVTRIDDKVYGEKTPDRNLLYMIQTPQTFRIDVLTEAYKELEKEPTKKITDDTMLIEQYANARTAIIPGDYRNIKITTPEDLLIATQFANAITHTTT